MSKYIMVLNDGETYTNIEGCAIVAVPEDADMESIEEQLDADDGTDYICEFRTNGDQIIATAPGGLPILMSHTPRGKRAAP